MMNTKQQRLKIYQKMLRDYRIARIFNFLTCGFLDVKEYYCVDNGFCGYLMNGKLSINLENLLELNKLRPIHISNNNCLWFFHGLLSPRIELLKKAISDTKMHIEIERLMLEK